MYIYIYIYIYIYAYANSNICVYIKHIHVYIYIYIYTHLFTASVLKCNMFVGQLQYVLLGYLQDVSPGDDARGAGARRRPVHHGGPAAGPAREPLSRSMPEARALGPRGSNSARNERTS